jgi:hypothetical protein
MEVVEKKSNRIDIPGRAIRKKSETRSIPMPASPIIYGQSMNTPNFNTPDFPNSKELLNKIYSNYLEKLNNCPLSL